MRKIRIIPSIGTWKLNFSADALFDFDKSALKPEGKGKTQPLTKPGDCKGKRGEALIACLRTNHRVDVEVTASKGVK